MTDPVEFIAAIHNAHIKYLLIGRQAMIAYGIPVQTMDYDLYIDGSRENTKNFLEIAEKFDLFPSKKLDEMESYFMFKLENDVSIDVFRAKKVITQKGETISFEEMYNRKEVITDETGFQVNVPCVEDLIKLKKTDRYKDTIDIKYLEKWQEMQKRKNK
ncbi:MAG: hypothetical protein AB1414_11080 [bacterium]